MQHAHRGRLPEPRHPRAHVPNAYSPSAHDFVDKIKDERKNAQPDYDDTVRIYALGDIIYFFVRDQEEVIKIVYNIDKNTVNAFFFSSLLMRHAACNWWRDVTCHKIFTSSSVHSHRLPLPEGYFTKFFSRWSILRLRRYRMRRDCIRCWEIKCKYLRKRIDGQRSSGGAHICQITTAGEKERTGSPDASNGMIIRKWYEL